jgi:hypothetical protein
MITMLIFFFLGFGLGYKLYHAPHVVEHDARQITMRDTSIVIQRITDTVTQIKLVKVPDTKIVHEVELQIVPDTTVKLDTLFRGDTVFITKTIAGDTITVTMHLLRQKDGGLRIQAKATNGTIVGAIDIPKESLTTTKPLKNFIGLQGTFAPKDGVINTGLIYNRSIGNFVLGGVLGTTINNYSNIQVGIQTGVTF